MRKALLTCGLAVALLGYLFFPPPEARATACSGFYTWNTGDTMTAARLNTINTVVTNCGNNVDNTNIGSAGIFASQIKGTSGANNTFGVSTAAATLNVPLILGASAITDSTNVEMRNDNAGTNGIFFNVPTGSTNGFRFGVNGSAVAQVNVDGSFIGACHGCVATTFYAPDYKNDGSAPANTLHVMGPLNVTTQLSSSCASLAVCSVNVTTFSLTNSAAYTSNITYGCFANDETGQVQWSFTTYASGLVTFSVRNVTGSTIVGTPNFNTVVFCIGT